jgi:hypothetical protein
MKFDSPQNAGDKVSSLVDNVAHTQNHAVASDWVTTSDSHSIYVFLLFGTNNFFHYLILPATLGPGVY